MGGVRPDHAAVSETSTAQSPDSAPQEWLIEGFHRALRRLNETISRGDVDPIETLIPLFETLHWFVAAKVESLFDPEDDAQRETWEKARAIRFARNRVNHHWADALSLQDKPFPTVTTNLAGGSRVIHPTVVKMWCWVPVEKLPVPEDQWHRDAEVGEPLYREHLAGHLALEALDAVAQTVPQT